MNETDFDVLCEWAEATLNMSALDVQCALVYVCGGDYDLSVISMQDAQQACAEFAPIADDVYNLPPAGDR